MATQLRNSDLFIHYKPLEKVIAKFNPAYTVLTASAAYPSLINKTDMRNSTSVAPKVTVIKDAEYTWHNEKQWGRVFKTKNESRTAADTVITIDDDSYDKSIVKNMVLEIGASKEHVIVTSVNGNAITVMRAPADKASGLLDGEVKCTALTAGTTVKVLGTALFDKDTGTPMRAVASTAEFKNYVQTFDVTYEITEQTEAFEFHGGPVKIRLTDKAAREASYNLEDSAVYGQPSKVVDPNNADNVKYTMMGLIPAIKAWQPDASKKWSLGGSALTFNKFKAFEKQFKKEGGEEVTYMCSENGLGYFDMWIEEKQRVYSGENVLGMQVTIVQCTLGKLRLVHLPALDNPDNNVDIIRFNPKDMEILQASPWGYRECGKDNAQTYSTHWLHGRFSMKFNLIPEKAGFICDLAPAYSMS